MSDKSYRYFQVFDKNTIREIEAPAAASDGTRWIIKQEYFYPCGSYTYSDFFFVDRVGEHISIAVADAEIGEILVRGTAASYILSIELKDVSGSSLKYRLYDDIRYGYGPVIGPKAFSPQYMEWDHSNPISEIVYYLYESPECDAPGLNFVWLEVVSGRAERFVYDETFYSFWMQLQVAFRR
jgi:hypothetical protein